MRGKFITFEGSEGSGKSTQSKLLYSYLKRKGLKVIFLREPGATKIGEEIRKVLLDHKNNSMTVSCEMLLYMAARAQVVGQIIQPALSRGVNVICDRFLDSTIAYQGYGLGLDIKLIKKVGDFATSGIKPDITIFLDLAVEAGLKHRRGLKDRIERRNLAYHRRVRSGYLRLARAYPQRIKVVTVEKLKNKTQKKIRGLVANVI